MRPIIMDVKNGFRVGTAALSSFAKSDPARAKPVAAVLDKLREINQSAERIPVECSVQHLIGVFNAQGQSFAAAKAGATKGTRYFDASGFSAGEKVSNKVKTGNDFKSSALHAPSSNDQHQQSVERIPVKGFVQQLIGVFNTQGQSSAAAKASATKGTRNLDASGFPAGEDGRKSLKTGDAFKQPVLQVPSSNDQHQRSAEMTPEKFSIQHLLGRFNVQGQSSANAKAGATKGTRDLDARGSNDQFKGLKLGANFQHKVLQTALANPQNKPATPASEGTKSAALSPSPKTSRTNDAADDQSLNFVSKLIAGAKQGNKDSLNTLINLTINKKAPYINDAVNFLLDLLSDKKITDMTDAARKELQSAAREGLFNLIKANDLLKTDTLPPTILLVVAEMSNGEQRSDCAGKIFLQFIRDYNSLALAMAESEDDEVLEFKKQMDEFITNNNEKGMASFIEEKAKNTKFQKILDNCFSALRQLNHSEVVNRLQAAGFDDNVVLGSDVMHNLKKYDNTSTFGKVLQKIAKNMASDTTSPMRECVPILDGGHWRLLTVEKTADSKIIFDVFDSLSFDSSTSKRVAQIFEKIYSAIPGVKQNQAIEWIERTRDQHVRIQKDSTSCGLFVSQAIDNIAAYPDQPVSDILDNLKAEFENINNNKGAGSPRITDKYRDWRLHSMIKTVIVNTQYQDQNAAAV